MKKTQLVKLTLKHTKTAPERTAEELAKARPKAATERRLPHPIAGPQIGDYVVGRVPDVTKFPYSTVGKLVFDWDGDIYYGSAWVCARAGIFTAAHNLYDEGKQSSNVVFYPQYADGPSPLGIAQMTVGWVPQVWYDSGDPNYDMASGVIDENFGDATGILPYTVNQPVVKDQPFIAVGYPAEPTPAHDYQGKFMWFSAGKLEAGHPSSIISMSSDFSEGASGGPWLTANNDANGTTFQTNPTPDEQLLSTYFDDLATALVHAVS